MENKKLGQEPAIGFTDIIISEDISFSKNMHTVLSKRFYAACKAMQGIIANPDIRRELSIPDIIISSYELADELLKQENE